MRHDPEHARSRIVIAPDSFKGTATADTAARNIGAGWLAVRPNDDVRLVPMADGGEGTIDALTTVFPAAERRTVRISGPDGRPVDAVWLYLPPTPEEPNGTGVVELASTSGITLMRSLEPYDAHSIGFGQAIVAALEAGVSKLILGVGGSSSTDGGAGMLAELGYQILDADDIPVRPGNRGIAHTSRVDSVNARPLPNQGVKILTDVTNPLTGPNGAAAVFGPQKGATPEDLALLDTALTRFASLFDVDPHTPGAGAGGGTAFGLMAWGGVSQSGAAELASLLNLPSLLEGTDLLITGEGRFDTQSHLGKVVGLLCQLADPLQVPVALVAGAVTANADGFADCVSLTHLAVTAEEAMAHSALYLRQAGSLMASRYQPGPC